VSRTEGLPAASAWAVGTWYAAGALTPLAEGERFGVLPPFWTLAVLAALAWLLVVAARVPRDTSRPLFLPLVALLPWLPAPLPPAMLIWVGPIGLALSGASAVTTAWLVRRERRSASASGMRPVLLVVLLAAVFALAAWRMAPVLPGGDEPHYLIITQSLLNDGDLRIEDNHQRREYVSYVEGELRPDYLRRGQDLEIYSIHPPGVSALVLPAFAIAGYPGAVGWLCLLSALGALVVWRASRTIGGTDAAAWFATIAVVLSAPFFFQAFTIYPDGPAALIVLIVFAIVLVRERAPGLREAFAAGLLLALLPWFHTRYAAIAGPLGLIVAGRLLWPARGRADGPDEPRGASWRSRLMLLAAFAAPALVSGVLWLSYFYAIYGVWDPRAPYGHATDMRLARIPHGLAGLFLDQQFGLLPNAPIYLVAAFGFGALWRRSRRLAVEIAVACVPYVLAVSAHHMWWGGRSSPVRFLVPVLLPMALPLAAWWGAPRSRAARTAGVLLLGFSLAMTATFVLVDRGLLVYNSRDGHALWLLALSRPVNLTYALPSLFQAGPPEAMRLAGVWACVAAIGFALLAIADRLGWRRGAWSLGVGVIAAAMLTGGVAAGWATTGAEPRDYGAGAAWVTARACDGGLRAYWTRSLRVQDARDAVDDLRIPDASRRPPRDAGPVWSALDLPPGTYRLTGHVETDEPVTMRIALGRPDATIATCGLGGSSRPDACTFELPAGAHALFAEPEAAARARVGDVAMRVESLGPEIDCDLRAQRAFSTPAGSLHVVAGRAWVERSGMWTAGTIPVTVVPSGPQGAATRLRLRQGAAPGLVTVSAGTWREERQLAAGEVWDVDIPARPHAGGVMRIEVRTDSAFRPSDVDPSSRDHRLLGVWITL
jgi:hypothetical protein